MFATKKKSCKMLCFSINQYNIWSLLAFLWRKENEVRQKVGIVYRRIIVYRRKCHPTCQDSEIDTAGWWRHKGIRMTTSRDNLSRSRHITFMMFDILRWNTSGRPHLTWGCHSHEINHLRCRLFKFMTSPSSSYLSHDIRISDGTSRGP